MTNLFPYMDFPIDISLWTYSLLVSQREFSRGKQFSEKILPMRFPKGNFPGKNIFPRKSPLLCFPKGNFYPGKTFSEKILSIRFSQRKFSWEIYSKGNATGESSTENIPKGHQRKYKFPSSLRGSEGDSSRILNN